MEHQEMDGYKDMNRINCRYMHIAYLSSSNPLMYPEIRACGWEDFSAQELMQISAELRRAALAHAMVLHGEFKLLNNQGEPNHV